MPELPEVTTIARGLNRSVRGNIIRDVWTDTPKLFAPLSFAAVKKALVGKAFLRFTRKGKYIVAEIGNPRAARAVAPLTLVWHMRMTGHPLYRNEKRETRSDTQVFADPRNQFIRATFFFRDGSRLEYSDVRKFGTLHLLPSRDLAAYTPLARLGPDALLHRWTADELLARLVRRRTTIKQALLDQTVIAGIGNIYADELLWEARIHPKRATSTITRAEAQRIVSMMQPLLRASVKRGGASMDDFRNIKGRKGRYGLIRKVYQRHNQTCFRCGATIAKLVVGGRGTHVCPQCQPAGATPPALLAGQPDPQLMNTKRRRSPF